MEFSQGRSDVSILLVPGRMACRDVEWKGQRVVSHIRRVMTGATGSRDLRWIAEFRIVIQPANGSDFQSSCIEDFLSRRDSRSGLSRKVAGITPIVLTISDLPAGIQSKDGGIKFFLVGVMTERIVNAGIIRLSVQIEWTASAVPCEEHSCAIIAHLRGRETQLKLHDL